MPAAFSKHLRRCRALFTLLACASALFATGAHARTLSIGVTLHPYYSFVANIVGDRAKVVPMIDSTFNPHAYEPRAEDIKRIGQLDVAASQRPKMPTIAANADVPLLSGMALGAPQGRAVNPHTFLSITASMLQVSTIARELGKLDPDNASFYQTNARNYNRKLRQLRADALLKLKQAPSSNYRVATEHGAYDYLLREFGLEVSAVIEPSHGTEPSPSQMKKVLDLIRAKNIKILFSEQDRLSGYVKTLVREADMRVYPLTHISHGAYSADAFEKAMAHNLDAVVRSILESKP